MAQLLHHKELRVGPIAFRLAGGCSGPTGVWGGWSIAQIGKAATGDARSVRPGAAQMTLFLESLAESSDVAASARAAGVTGNAMLSRTAA